MKKSGRIAPRVIMVCAAGIVAVLTISAFSFGWFSGSSSVSVNGAGMTAVDGEFELAALDRNGTYDSLLSAPDGESTDGIAAEDGSPISLTATSSEKNKIKWLMSDDSNFGNLSAEGIRPGSSGKLTFYVIAKQNGELNLTFALDTVLYDKDAKPVDESNDNSGNIITDSEKATELVKGHIMFFRNYNETTGLYSGKITDNFDFTVENAVKNTAYKADIYWVWPYVIDQLLLPSEDSLITGRGYKRITTESVISAEKAGEFFVETPSQLADMLENVGKGSDDEAFNRDYYDTLNAAWNNADQEIGTKVGYIELTLTADKKF